MRYTAITLMKLIINYVSVAVNIVNCCFSRAISLAHFASLFSLVASVFCDPLSQDFRVYHLRFYKLHCRQRHFHSSSTIICPFRRSVRTWWKLKVKRIECSKNKNMLHVFSMVPLTSVPYRMFYRSVTLYRTV